MYKYSWFPRRDTFKPFSFPTLPAETVVADLLDTYYEWDVDKLNQHFMLEDTEAVVKLPLPRTQQQDKVCGILTKEREYSMKRGYHLALKIKCPAV